MTGRAAAGTALLVLILCAWAGTSLASGDSYAELDGCLRELDALIMAVDGLTPDASPAGIEAVLAETAKAKSLINKVYQLAEDARQVHDGQQPFMTYGFITAREDALRRAVARLADKLVQGGHEAAAKTVSEAVAASPSPGTPGG